MTRLAARVSLACALASGWLACTTRAEPTARAPLDPARAPWNVGARARPDAQLARLMERVARARELEPREPPTLVRLPRDALVERALAHTAATARPGALEAEAQLLWALELVPADFAWPRALRRAFDASLLAFYDAQGGEHGELVVDAALGPASRQRVLAHELAHALVDQHFGLAARLRDESASADARAALHLLAEGDAEAVTQQLWPEDEGVGLAADAAPPALEGDPRQPVLPAVVGRALSAAYTDGAAAVRRLRASAGWRAVDALYRSPPRSTRQLLDGEAGELLPASAAGPPSAAEHERLPPSGGWRVVYGDVLGQQALRIVLEEWLAPQLAAALARDWDADRLSVFERGPERVLVWELRWRQGAGAHAAAALRAALRLPAPAPAEPPGSFVCREHRDAGVVGQRAAADQLWLGHLRSGPREAGCEQLAGWARDAR